MDILYFCRRFHFLSHMYVHFNNEKKTCKEWTYRTFPMLRDSLPLLTGRNGSDWSMVHLPSRSTPSLSFLSEFFSCGECLRNASCSFTSLPSLTALTPWNDTPVEGTVRDGNISSKIDFNWITIRKVNYRHAVVAMRLSVSYLLFMNLLSRDERQWARDPLTAPQHANRSR